MATSDGGSISKPLIEEERRMIIVYRECRRNHAILVGGYAVDGCSEFAPKVDQCTKESLLCDACGCHRNFHRKVILRNGVTIVESHHSYPPYQLLSPSCGTRNDIACSPFPSVSPPSVPHYQQHCSLSNPQTVGTDEESVIYNGSEKEVEMRARKRPRNNSSK